MKNDNQTNINRPWHERLIAYETEYHAPDMPNMECWVYSGCWLITPLRAQDTGEDADVYWVKYDGYLDHLAITDHVDSHFPECDRITTTYTADDHENLAKPILPRPIMETLDYLHKYKKPFLKNFYGHFFMNHHGQILIGVDPKTTPVLPF